MTLSPKARAAGLRSERMRASPLFFEGRFRNVHPILTSLKTGVPMPPLWDFFRGRPGKKPLSALPSVDPRAAWSSPVESGLRATWLGHSTVLVEIDGVRVLTDPVWGARLSPVPLLAPKRFQPVPVAIADLPPLDAVLVSHDHFDHLDVQSIRELAQRDVPFITALGVGEHLASWGVPEARIHELDWWEEWAIAGGRLRVTATPSQHFSGRGLTRNRTLWTSFAVRGERHSFFFSGDTGLTTEFADVREKLGPFDLVMLEVGAFHPAWADIHLGPVHALEALAMLGGGSLLPVHWGTFDLAMHTWDEPAEELLRLAPLQDVHLLMPKLGAAIEPRHSERVEPWWRPVAALEARDNAAGRRAEDALRRRAVARSVEETTASADVTPAPLPLPLD